MKREVCIRCGACSKACPVDAIHMDSETGFPIVCIHCGLCVPFCPHACLEVVEAEDGKDHAR